MVLNENLGLPIASKEDELLLPEHLVETKGIISYKGNDLKTLTKKQKWTEKEKEELIYKTYLDVKRIEDKSYWEKVQFDILMILSGKIGNEFKKTRAYYRSIADNGVHYPEVFQVAEGYIEFFLQKPTKKHTIVNDIVVIRAQKMDIIAVPPSYGVTLINPADKNAVVGRIRSREVEEIVEPFEETQGESYYKLTDGRWEYNAKYDEIPMLKLEPTQNSWRHMKRGTPVYESQIKHPNAVAPLVIPNPLDFNL